ncbi:hypothetical protein TCDM_05209 [Trypanosoma cruzi Dm28c]|uniref:Rapamycin-insensitive companion of TOR2 n=2 Tax=Trypanosoma cruzi TaxID=5693 RepID=V5BNR6_TRYCR|nr:hypothetical protein TCDM_05209 [Trypanosoma cruzi Dm28c]PBJ79704.1 hypothetical protein BCY84_02434 [Trypanosoma cruzi cruzi]PWU97306.1 Rapamycin-insensitive companion of TOR2 [Trypanosoma cruzi]
MVVSGLSAASAELLQQFGIDPKDFSKARVRYEKVQEELREEGLEAKGETTDAAAKAEETLQRLTGAWAEYLCLTQKYFIKITSTVIDDLMNKIREKASAAERAEKLNELCAIGEKWYVRNEAYFEFEDPEKLALLVKGALDSSSRVMRLLGLQLVRICAASVRFTQCLLKNVGCGLIGLCFDREIATELEYALNVCTRLIELHESNPTAYPDFPYGWICRISSLLDPQDPVPNLQPKRKSQALRIAIKLLRRFPAMSTAASLHTILLRYCIQKGAATMDEIKNILHVILDLFDCAETRQYLRYNDLDVLYVPFLYTTDKSTEANINLMNGAKDVLAMVMRTWVGVLWTCSETKGLRAVIDVLHLPGDLDRKMVLLTLFNKVLCQLAPHRGLAALKTWQGVEKNKRETLNSDTISSELTSSFMEFSSSRISGEYAKTQTFPEGGIFMDQSEVQDNFVPTTKAIGYHVLDPLLGRVLLMLFHHGLPLALVSMIGDGASSRLLASTASSLLQDIFVLMDTVLPVRPAGRLHTALNEAVGRLIQQGDLSFRSGPTASLFQYHRMIKDVSLATTVAGTNAISGGRAIIPSATTISAYGLGTMGADDAGFEALLRQTGVDRADGFVGWNQDLLLLLVQGPLRSMPRFQWVLKETRFFHKLIAFYQPSLQAQSRTFVSLRTEECTPQLCNFGLALLDMFLSTRVGTEVLDQFGFTSAIVRNLKEVVDGTPQVLNRERLGTRVGQTVLQMVGRYSLSANGLVAMREHNMFGIINNMFDELSGERAAAPSPNDTLQDVCQLILQSLYIGAVPNYGVCEEIRHSIRSALCNDVNSVRLYAATQLHKALWRDLSTSMRWGIETLVQALHDEFYSVVESAFKLLLSICLCSEEALDYLISLSPAVLMESEVIRQHSKDLDLNKLLYCIVGRTSGLRFLQFYGWVDEELRRWEESESANHVRLVERMQSGEAVEASVEFIHNMFSQRRQFHDRTISDPIYTLYRPTVLSRSIPTYSPPSESVSGFFPSHFAAFLCKSNEGCTLFKHSVLWQRSVQRILQQPLPPDIVYDGSDARSGGSDDDIDDDERVLNEEDPSFWGQLGAKTEMAETTKSVEGCDLRLLRAGCLPCSRDAQLLSAARGYKTPGRSYLLKSVGDVAELKDAILCVCHASSSDTGFALMRSVPGLHKRLNALMLFGATVSVRSICFVGECIQARSRRCAEQLSDMSRYVLHECNAYTSADGVPYSVAFSHIKPSRWTPIGRPTNQWGVSSLFFIYRQECSGKADEIPYFTLEGARSIEALGQSARRVFDQVCTLSNPVSREGAKKKLCQVLKNQPHIFLEPRMRKLIIDATQMFRMQHAERKFIADLLENAPLAKPVPSARRATIVVPSLTRLN